MRIGLVLPETPQYSETFFNAKIKGLQESGFEVILFSNKKGNPDFQSVIAYPVNSKNKFVQFFRVAAINLFTFLSRPSAVLKLMSLDAKDGKTISQRMRSIYINAHILRYKTDWLHFGFATMALKRENAAKAIGAKMGVSFRGFDINVYPLKNPGCYDRLWKKVDKVHTISGYLHAKAMEFGLEKDKPFQKITPALDLELFKMKDEAGKINSPLKILTVGRLNWIKDYETAISAMKILKSRDINFQYNIIGTGKELERLKFAVYQSGLENEIVFSGKKSHNEINEIMRKSDIYLQTSLQEGFCVSALEAQATGLLCIVSDADGLKENVIDARTGWIAKRRSPKAFAEKIIQVISLPEEQRRETVNAARKRIEEDFSIEDQKIKFKKFFTE